MDSREPKGNCSRQEVYLFLQEVDVVNKNMYITKSNY